MQSLEQWAEEWRQTRRLTYDLLAALPYAVLNFSPHPDFGTFARQIRHMGDIQACYIMGLQTEKMDFGARPRQRTLEQSREHLEGYLRSLDAQLEEVLRGISGASPGRSIAWDGEAVPVLRHLMRLIQHETLHHGMLALYAKIADLPLPPSWGIWALE
ncbi:MAG: DinB family protein [Armatimonadota bacterium]|nr:DinB family protein [Armatimonadota bacterium]